MRPSVATRRAESLAGESESETPLRADHTEELLVVVAGMAITAAVLYDQYRKTRTAGSRALGMA